MSPERDSGRVRLALPKGRMQAGISTLFEEAGIRLCSGARNYRPSISLDGFEVKVLKPQTVVEMLHVGSRDVGFAGADWVRELEADVVELFDTGLDPVQLVAAGPPELAAPGALDGRSLIVSTEYLRIGRAWVEERGLEATLVRSYGATEVLPPEDADLILDNTATGATLAANGLVILDTCMASSTRLYASPRALEDREVRARIEEMTLLLRSVVEARGRVMLELNITPDKLDGVVQALPSMRKPTIASLHDKAGFAVRAAVPRRDLPRLVPEIKLRGGTDIVVSTLAQIVP